MEKHFQTSISSGRIKIFVIADNGGWRKMIGVLLEMGHKTFVVFFEAEAVIKETTGRALKR